MRYQVTCEQGISLLHYAVRWKSRRQVSIVKKRIRTEPMDSCTHEDKTLAKWSTYCKVHKTYIWCLILARFTVDKINWGSFTEQVTECGACTERLERKLSYLFKLFYWTVFCGYLYHPYWLSSKYNMFWSLSLHVKGSRGNIFNQTLRATRVFKRKLFSIIV